MLTRLIITNVIFCTFVFLCTKKRLSFIFNYTTAIKTSNNSYNVNNEFVTSNIICIFKTHK